MAKQSARKWRVLKININLSYLLILFFDFKPLLDDDLEELKQFQSQLKV